MIKKFYLFIALILLTVSCSQTEKEISQPKYNKVEIEQIVDEHLENTIRVFQDSMDSKKGFLGWRNIRDYVGLGNENFRERTLATWDKVYDNEKLESIIEENLVTQNRVDLELDKGNKHIGQYIHKISLSFIVLVLEGLFEFLLSLFFGYTFAATVAFIFVFYQFSYGGWKRWSKPRRGRFWNIISITGKIASFTALIVTIIIGFYGGDYSNDALTKKIKTDIQNEISAQIEDKI